MWKNKPDEKAGVTTTIKPYNSGLDNMKLPKISEDDLQRQCISWFKWQYKDYSKRIFHPANGGTRNVIEAKKFKAMGVLPGVSDIIVTIPRNGFGGLFCELKVGKNELSEHQEAFIKEHEADYSCHVIRSLDEFMEVVNKYLKAA